MEKGEKIKDKDEERGKPEISKKLLRKVL